MAYNYVVSAQKSSAVNHAVSGRITGPDDINLVLAKSTRIEIHRLTLDGLVLVHDIAVFGKIASLELLRIPKEKQDCLFLVTERAQYMILKYDAARGELLTVASGSARDRIGRQREGPMMGLVDPAGRAVALHIYEGQFKVVPIGPCGQLRDAFDVRVDEPEVHDAVFLHGTPEPTLAVLCEDQDGRRRLKTVVLTSRNREGAAGPWPVFDCERWADKLAAVPGGRGGVLVFGHQTVSYVRGDVRKLAAVPNARFVAVEAVDGDGTRFLAADHAGRLHVVILTLGAPSAAAARSAAVSGMAGGSGALGGGDIEALHVETLGETSCAACIAYLDQGIAFVGSVLGDSQLLRLLDDPLPADAGGGFVEPLEAFPNLGPVLDMCVVDVERQGQGQVVTCSGAYRDGSLRVVRNGIGINEIMGAEMLGLKGVWSLRESTASPHDSFIVQSFISETRLYKYRLGEKDEEGEDDESRKEWALRETPIEEFLDGRTLLAANVVGDLLVQVVEMGVALVDAVTKKRVAEWQPPVGLRATVAAANEARVLVACGGGHLFHLAVDAASRRLVEAAHVTLEHEIACISINPAANTAAAAGAPKGDSMAYDDNGGSGGSLSDADGVFARAAGAAAAAAAPAELDGLVAVGMWTDNTVRLLSLPALAPVLSQPLGGDTQARSVLLVTLGGAHYLLVGLGDGHLIHYTLAPAGAMVAAAAGAMAVALQSRKRLSLGTQPLGLTCFRNGGATCVFVTGDRPTVVHASPTRGGGASSSGGGGIAVPAKLQYDSVNMADVSCICSYNAEENPNCLALASENKLVIGTIDEMQKLHIRSVPLGEMPRRVCHAEAARCFALVTVAFRAPEAPAAAAAAAAAAAMASGGEEEQQDIVRFLDDATFDSIYEYTLDPMEIGFSLAVCGFEGSGGGGGSASGGGGGSANGGCGSGSNGKRSFVAVGTAYVQEGQQDPRAGRILVFCVEGVGADRRVHLAAETRTAGAVYCLSAAEGRLLAGVNSRVCMYRWAPRRGAAGAAAARAAVSKTMSLAGGSGLGGGGGGLDDAAHELELESSLKCQVVALFMQTRGHFVLVGDLMRSLTLLALVPASGELGSGGTGGGGGSTSGGGDGSCSGGGGGGGCLVLQEIARDYDAKWMSAVAMLDDEVFLGAEYCSNLFTVRKNAEAVTEEERARLEPQGEFHLGEIVNRFVRGSLVREPTVDAAATAEAGGIVLAGQTVLFGTVSGAIGAVLPLAAATFAWLDALQRGMQGVVRGLGITSHADWRAVATPRRSAPARNFVDGDLIESFLDLPRTTQEQIIARMLEEAPPAEAEGGMAAPVASAAASTAVPISPGTAGGVGDSAGAAGGSSAASSVLCGGRELTPERLARALEEVCRRVEDLSRLH